MGDQSNKKREGKERRKERRRKGKEGMTFGTVIYEVHSDYRGRTRDVAVAIATLL